MSRGVVWGVVALVAMSSVAAAADRFEWSWSAGDAPLPQSHAAGSFASVFAAFDTGSNLLTWQVGFADALTDGLALVVSDGALPGTELGRYAIVYMDATQGVRVTAYGYNGARPIRSWEDGDASTAGLQAPDLIHSAHDTDWIQAASVADEAGARTFSLTIDVTDILQHAPKYTDGSSWHGMGFGPKLGFSMRTFGLLTTSYDADGALTGFDFGLLGRFGAGSVSAVVVPLPPAAGLAGAGLFGLLACRSRFARRAR